MTLEAWQGSIDGLVIGDGTPYDVVTVSGLDEHPAVRSSDVERAHADGEHAGDDYLEGRTITVQLEVMADAGVSYLDALAALRRACRPKRTVEWSFRLPGQEQRFADVRVRRFAIPTDRQYEMGLATADVQLRSTDALLYGHPLDVTFAAARPAGGMRFPLFRPGYLDFGARGETGRRVLVNEGTEAVWPQFLVTGPMPPFDLVHVQSGRRVAFSRRVNAGDELLFDFATGVVVSNGGAVDYSGDLTSSQWFPVPPDSEPCTVAVVLHGPREEGTVTATWRPGFL